MSPGADSDSGMVAETGAPNVGDAAAKKDSAASADTGSCVQHTFYRDSDGDGFGDPVMTQSACSAPTGYVPDKTDCDDTDATVHPGAIEVCGPVDNDCDGTTATEVAACTAFAGSYMGTYKMHTTEKVGTTVVNEVTCTGTSALTIDLTKKSVLNGTVTCSYSGGLTAFSTTEKGTIQASVLPDGTIHGTLTHQFDALDSSTVRTFTFAGTAAGSTIAVNQTGGSWLPNPASAQAWDVDFTITATK